MFHRRIYAGKILFLLGLLLCLMAGLARAEVTFPDHVNKYVNDFAGILTQDDVNFIGNMLSDLDHSSGVEMTVVTITSLADQGATGLPLKTYAAGLFDTWGVGSKDRNDGVMLMFSLNDRQVWIEMGLSYAGRHDANLQRVVDNIMLPHFRNGDYSTGLYQGVAGIVGVLSGVAPAEGTRPVGGGSATGGQPVYGGGSTTTKEGWIVLGVLVALIIIFIAAGISMMRKGKKGWGFVFFGIAGAILLFLLKMVFSGKKRGGGGFGGGRSGGGGAGGSW